MAYRLESERTFNVTNEYSERRDRAKLMNILRSCLFGKKRYQNIILASGLNNFFNAIRIASILNNKVPQLAMIIKFIPFVVVEMMANGTSK